MARDLPAPPLPPLPDGEQCSRHVQAILTRIAEDFATPLTLKQLASELGRQSEYLGWLFRYETGMTFRECLTLTRLREAVQLIESGAKIEAAALLVGYRSKKNLYEQFRKYFQTTPAELRSRLARSADRDVHEDADHQAGPDDAECVGVDSDRRHQG